MQIKPKLYLLQLMALGPPKVDVVGIIHEAASRSRPERRREQERRPEDISEALAIAQSLAKSKPDSEWERFKTSVGAEPAAEQAQSGSEPDVAEDPWPCAEPGSHFHVANLVAKGTDTLAALVDATGLGRTTVQSRLKTLVSEGHLRIAEPSRGGKPARYEISA